MASPGIKADSSTDALKAQLDEVWTALDELGRSLDDDQWQCATPCPGWSVAAQYAHVIGTESMLLGRPNPEVDPGEQAHVRNDIGGFNEVWVAYLSDKSRAEVMDAFGEVIDARRHALASMGEAEFDAPSWTPVGQADYRRFMQTRTFDCWVHEQDIRDAIGRPGHDGGPAAEQALDEIVRALGFVIGKRAGVPSGHSVRLDLTGPLSRRLEVDVTDRARVVDALAGEPTTALILEGGLFTRLACGRVAGADARDRVEIKGDDSLGAQVLSNLAFTI